MDGGLNIRSLSCTPKAKSPYPWTPSLTTLQQRQRALWNSSILQAGPWPLQ